MKNTYQPILISIILSISSSLKLLSPPRNLTKPLNSEPPLANSSHKFETLSSTFLNIIENKNETQNSPVDLVKSKLLSLQSSISQNQEIFEKIKSQQSQFDTEIKDLQTVVSASIDKQDQLNNDIQKVVDYYNKQREDIEDLVIETNKKPFSANENIDQIFQQGNIHATFEKEPAAKVEATNNKVK